MTHYTWFQIALAAATYTYLLNQFQVGYRKHTGTIIEAIQSGGSIEQLTGKYWNILLALLACLLIAGPISLADNNHALRGGWIPVCICLLTLLTSMFSKMPRIEHTSIPISFSRYYIFIRATYLILYEIFFRGLLLQLTLTACTPVLAISINVLLYTLAHIYSPRRELVACIPLGFLFCWLRLEYGSILYPILLHLCIAVPFEIRILFASTLHSQNNKP